jgi:hypothetical protein
VVGMRNAIYKAISCIHSLKSIGRKNKKGAQKMFDILQRNATDFDRRGNLKSNVEFSFCGEVRTLSIKEVRSYKPGQDEGEKPPLSYAVSMEDCYGFQCSYWHRSLSLEKAARLMENFPREETVFIRGEVSIRKGRTYFNAKLFEYPNGESIPVFSAISNNETTIDDAEGSQEMHFLPEVER